MVFSEIDPDLIRRIRSHPSNNFVELVQLAGLNPAADFQHLDLSRTNFRDCDLRGFDFRGSRLVGAKFRQARISGAIFDEEQKELPELVGALDYGGAIHVAPAEILSLSHEQKQQNFRDSCYSGRIRTMRDYIASGVDIDDEIWFTGDTYETALIALARYQRRYGPHYPPALKSAEFLLRAGADVNHRMRADNWTALLGAVADEWAAAVALLLEYGADPNATNKQGRTPLSEAVTRNLPQIASELVAAGADPHHPTSVFGYPAQTPYEMAKGDGLSEILSLFPPPPEEKS